MSKMSYSPEIRMNHLIYFRLFHVRGLKMRACGAMLQCRRSSKQQVSIYCCKKGNFR